MQQGVLIQYFHWYIPSDGNFWKQLRDEATSLRRMGFTSVWFPPAHKGASGGFSIGYDSYDLYDLGEFDQKGSVRTKYGTKQEFLEAIWAVKNAGMSVMVDIVLNHKAGGDEIEQVKAVKVNPQNRNQVISEPLDIDVFTKFTFPGRGKKYSAFEWNHTCFIGIDFAYNLDDRGIFRILTDHENSWQPVLGDEKGNFDYLMYNDIDHRNPFVREELNVWAKWFWDLTQFDAVRLDAVKHIDPNFYVEWLNKLRQQTGKEIFAVGEYWNPGNTEILLNYSHITGQTMSLFDVTLQLNFHHASKAGPSGDLRTIFANSLVQALPQKAVTIVSNHDTQPLQQLESVVEAWFVPLAYALILLREEGYPCVFYPHLYGVSYKDYGQDGQEYEIHLPKIEELEILLAVRAQCAYGVQRDFFESPNCIGWTREGDDTHTGCAVVLSNSESATLNMEMGKHNAGKKMKDRLQKIKEEIVVNEDGWAQFSVTEGSVSVWVMA